MGIVTTKIKSIVLAAGLTVGFSIPGTTQPVQSDDLMDRLRNSTPDTYRVIEREVMLEWSKSGSAAMDLLLERGQDALETGDFQTAVEHLTALTDHAPDFAEGFHARATAFFRLEQYGPALADLERTLELNPDHFGALTGVGYIFEELGYEQQALNALRKARGIHPHYEEITDLLEYLEDKVEGHAL
ncbi:tetratricopeptide repeat protein [Parasulfitobacter algicola]|uniref:Tetratricopeptide repeat protein n=1 Tax=Parasulfitobacter algicola TaxID=2614809 RepID=A0ABX2IVI8_9RHOB|nr:tetratricopeptide repeat protein [Sulfitobacter algicola]NSX54291.1 tetratricopeptide repeat protein [Sulfitobacter algicola]